ncbi:DUF3048 domain-containing protein [Metabacillus sp. HB246100]
MLKGKVSILLFSSLLLMSACSKEEDIASVNEDQLIQQEQPAAVEVETIQHPLTGLVAEQEEITQRPVAVMINNHPAARPQSGLHKADLVYEVLAEGNITRFLAVFQSEIPDIIGPVRSARPYYIDLSKGFQSLYIAHGYSPIAKEKLDNGEVNSINGMKYDGSLFWRADHRVAPHNSYISKENILKGAEKEGFETTTDVEPLDFLKEEETNDLIGEPLNKFVIKYDNSLTWQATYEYNQADKRYSRYSNNEQTVDLESGEAISLANVFVVEMDHQIKDDYGRRDINLTSGGKALLFQNGRQYEVEWENKDGRILPVSGGEAVKLAPGRTWINIVPDLSTSFLVQS